MTSCLVVLTARGPQRIIDEHGSQAWRLNPQNAKQLEYCVCVQNQHNGHWGGASEEHHHASWSAASRTSSYPRSVPTDI